MTRTCLVRGAPGRTKSTTQKSSPRARLETVQVASKRIGLRNGTKAAGGAWLNPRTSVSASLTEERGVAEPWRRPAKHQVPPETTRAKSDRAKQHTVIFGNSACGLPMWITQLKLQYEE
jgi:hypothetical protein